MKKSNSEVRINTLIGEGTELSGDFAAKGSVRIDGKVNGDVHVTGLLILGATGEIIGDITADAALLGGEVEGNIVVTQKTELTSSARIIGDITTALIVIDEHAVFQGGCNMNQSVSEKGSKARNAKAIKEDRKMAKSIMDDALREVLEESSGESVSAAGAESL